MSEPKQTDPRAIKLVIRQIEPHGDFFPQTAEGAIINTASRDKIPESVLPLIDDVIAVYQQRLAECLHSVYIRGSIVHGMSVKGFSDLDTFALVKPTEQQPFIWWCTPDWEAEAAQTLLAQHDDGWVTNIDFGYASWHEDFIKRNPTLAVIIKTQSLCVVGTDVKPLLPNLRAGLEICRDYLFLENELALLSKMISGQIPLEVSKAQAVVKRMIRVAFELVMEREQRYTTSLYHCYDCFGRYYPQQREAMRQLLEFYLNPSSDLDAIAQCLTCGQWLKKQVDIDLRPRLVALASVEQ